MKKILLSLSLCVSFFASAQVTIFEDNFDSYDDFIITGFGNWQTLDIDLLNTYTGGLPTGGTPWLNSGAPQAFQIFNPSVATVSNATSGSEVRNFDPNSGLKYAACWGAVPSTTAGEPVANEDWLISQPIDLTGATGSSLSVWVKSLSNSYGLEKYKIGVYVGVGVPTASSDFTIISGAASLSAPYPNWAEKVISIGAYDGQTIRIGIECVSADVYMFMVDNFKVTATSVLSTTNFSANQFAVSPNPAADFIAVSNTENIKINAISITDLNGRVVKQINYSNVSDIQVNITDLTSGMYMMNINSENGIVTKKIVKK